MSFRDGQSLFLNISAHIFFQKNGHFLWTSAAKRASLGSYGDAYEPPATARPDRRGSPAGPRPVEVKAWLTTAAMEPVKVSPLRKKNKKPLS